MHERLRQARLSRGLTQTQLAAISGVEQANISAIERGRRTPSAITARRLLAACGYELLAVAGPRVIDLGVTANDAPGDAPVDRLAADTDTRTRARMLVAVLEVAESIVRAR
jgi:transcriptional regulator with XRE-family HTH domain